VIAVPARRCQGGVAAVEFALVASLFFTALLGAMEMGRLLWTWNAAVETTRFGARMAVVCDLNDADIATRMIARMPHLASAQIQVEYLNPPFAVNTCDTASCQAVRVSLTGYTHDTVIPFVPLSLTLPPFSTTLRKEFMNSTGNAACS
jgi:Flp pilus assembly protein TadG